MGQHPGDPHLLGPGARVPQLPGPQQHRILRWFVQIAGRKRKGVSQDLGREGAGGGGVWVRPSIPLEAVSSCDHPAAAEQGARTVVGAVLLEAHDPGPLGVGAVFATYDPVQLLGLPAGWGCWRRRGPFLSPGAFWPCWHPVSSWPPPASALPRCLPAPSAPCCPAPGPRPVPALPCRPRRCLLGALVTCSPHRGHKRPLPPRRTPLTGDLRSTEGGWGRDKEGSGGGGEPPGARGRSPGPGWGISWSPGWAMETSGWKLRPPLPPASCPACACAPCHLPAGGGTGSWVPGTEGRGGEPTPTLWGAPPRPEAAARETLSTPHPRPGSLRTQELGGTRTRSGLCPESSPAGSHWTWQRGASQCRRGGDRAGGDRAEGRGQAGAGGQGKALGMDGDGPQVVRTHLQKPEAARG